MGRFPDPKLFNDLVISSINGVPVRVRDIGYAGYLSAEILPLPDSDTAAAKTMESFRRLTRRQKPD